jgi:hypothetical protein
MTLFMLLMVVVCFLQASTCTGAGVMVGAHRVHAHQHARAGGEGAEDSSASAEEVASASEDTGAASSAVAADEAAADGSADDKPSDEEPEVADSASEMVQTNKADEKVGSMQKGVNGKIKINGEIYEAKCDCSKDALLKAKTKALAIESSKRCKRPTKYRVFYERRQGLGQKGSLTSDQLLEFLGKPSSLKWVNASKRSLSDVDGRMEGDVLATPAGEMGEFILAVDKYFQAMDKKDADDAAIRKYLEEYLKFTAPRKFPLHTTARALETLEKELSEPELDLLEPRDAVRAQLLGKECPDGDKDTCGLMNPANVGVAHLKLMLEFSNTYHVSKEVVRGCIRAFYSLLWDGDDALSKQLNFTVLDTKHTEGAWVNVRVSKGCREEMKVPLITPRKDTSSGDVKSSSSIFLSHPDAASVRRRQLADWFAQQDPKHHVQADALFAQLERAGMAALSETARHLARGMPIYTVTVQ